MSKTKKIISLALTLLMVVNIFSVVAFATDDLADYSALTDYIQKNVPTDNNAGIYSSDSYATVEATLNYIDYQLPASSQDTVDGYLSNLKAAVAGLVADETKAVAQFGLEGTSAALHPGDTATVTLSLETNYRVISAGVAIIYDSTVLELVGGGSTITDNVVHYSEGVLSAYNLTGSNSNTAKIFANRNSNTAYWNTEAMKSQYTVLNLGFSLNSKISDPVIANGTVATMTFRVLSNAQFGTEGAIFISSDFNKTSSFAGGLNYASRSVGQKMGPVSSCITVGQTLDFTEADIDLSVNHTLVTTEAVAATCTTPGTSSATVTCSVCGAVISEGTVVPALGHDYKAVETPATCTAAGYTTYTCSRCGDNYIAEGAAATGHTWNEGEITTAPTCVAPGVKTLTCTSCGVTTTQVVEATGHTPGQETKEVIDGVEKNVIRCTVCGEIISASEIQLADYTELNAAVAAAQAIEPNYVYDTAKYATLMAYIENIDYTLNSDQQAEVDAYTAAINGYMNGIMILDQLRVADGTATIDGTTITLTVKPGKEQVTVYATLRNKDAVTFSQLDGPKKSSSGTLYSKMNGTATVTFLDGRSFTLLFAIKDAAEDVADYTAVDAALVKAAAIKEEDVYDAATYTALETAVNAVVRGLHEKDQKIVNGYATAINNAVKNAVTVQDLIRHSANATVEKQGDTIVITRKSTARDNYMLVYNVLTNGTSVTFERRGKLVAISDGIRFKIAQNTTAKILLENGKEYNVLFVNSSLSDTGYDALEALATKEQSLVADDYYDYSKVTAALQEIDWKLDEAEDMATINYYVVTLDEALSSLKLLVNMLKLLNGYASKDGETFTLSRLPGKTTLGLYTKLTNGETIEIFDRVGLKRYSDGSKYYTSDEGSAKITLKDGRTFNVIFSTTLVNEFRPEFVRYVYVDGYDYDSYTNALELETTSTIARIYKSAVSSRLSINVEDYDFITEADSYYQVNSAKLKYSDKGIATFIISCNDGTEINASVSFVNVAAKSIIGFMTIGHASAASVDGDTINIELKYGDAYVSISDTLKTGESFSITSSSSYVQHKNGSFILRKGALGAEITLTYGEEVYTVNFTEGAAPEEPAE